MLYQVGKVKVNDIKGCLGVMKNALLTHLIFFHGNQGSGPSPEGQDQAKGSRGQEVQGSREFSGLGRGTCGVKE